MKFALATKGPANRAEAWACVTSNIALPGSGSLAAGKSIGYFQLGLGGVGLVLSVATGIHYMQWTMENWARINQATGDPLDILAAIWHQVMWPLAGLAMFGIAFVWAIITSMQILASFPKNPVPPRIVNH